MALAARARLSAVRVASFVGLFVTALVLAGCATPQRLPAVPLSLAADAVPLDIPDARYYADSDVDRISLLANQAYHRAKAASFNDTKHRQRYFLAISGGGDDGAFGAGLLAGWSARGDRPQFTVVTGVSTGALSAPFAFLGPEYDEQLKSIYTETGPDDVFQPRSLMAAVANDAMTDATPLRNTIASFVDADMVQRIAEEYGKGRILLILTTNLDQGRSVIWNIGAIAASGHPRARELIVDVLLASASLPGIFPPVMIGITVNGKHYQEMHVDGGAVSQVFLYPPSFNLKKKMRELHVTDAKPVAYIIRNGRLRRPEEDVERKTLKIAQQAISTMTTSNGVNDLYRMYLTTKRDGVAFNMAYIDEGFHVPYKGPFDKAYMNALYTHGYRMGIAGHEWHNTPPGYQE